MKTKPGNYCRTAQEKGKRPRPIYIIKEENVNL